MNGVQCYELFGGIALKNHAFFIYIRKETKVKLINHDCLPILMFLYITLYIMLAYLMLSVCIMLFVFMLRDVKK